MRTISTLTNAYLARATKLNSIDPLRFSAKRGSYFDYAEASNLGMYIRIPSSNHDDVEAIIDAIEEVGIARWKETLLPKGSAIECKEMHRKTITTLFIKCDSGIPEPDALKAVLEAAEKNFTITDGIGLEIASSDTTEDRLRTLKDLGITHLAVNVGAEAYEPLKDPTVIGGLTALREVAFDTVSLNLVFAQPGQPAEHFRCIIETMLAGGANHITIKPFNSFEEKRITGKLSGGSDSPVCFGCAATTLMASRFRVNTYSIAEYGRRLDAGKAPAAMALKVVERERMVRYLLWTLSAEIRAILAQARLLHGVGSRKRL